MKSFIEFNGYIVNINYIKRMVDIKDEEAFSIILFLTENETMLERFPNELDWKNRYNEIKRLVMS